MVIRAAGSGPYVTDGETSAKACARATTSRRSPMSAHRNCWPTAGQGVGQRPPKKAPSETPRKTPAKEGARQKAATRRPNRLEFLGGEARSVGSGCAGGEGDGSREIVRVIGEA